MSLKAIFSHVLALTLLTLPALASSQKTSKNLEFVLNHYLIIQSALAKDSFETAKSSAQELKDFLSNQTPQTSEPSQVLFSELTVPVAQFLTAPSHEKARIEFGNISKPLVTFLKANKGQSASYQLFFCPMFPKGYAFWIQKNNTALANPYWGKEMLECGVKRPW